MNNSINLIMPMGGSGSRFLQEGINTPKPLILLKGKPFFYWATQSLNNFVNIKKLIFVVLQQHIIDFKIDEVILSFYPNAEFVYLEKVLDGAVLTCREGIKCINNDLPVIFNDCDHLFHSPKLYDFCKKGLYSDPDGMLLTFKSTDPKFSYLKYDDTGFVRETVEKKVISDDAICGAYYFKNRDTFKNASGNYLTNCMYTEYFISGVYNSLISLGGKVKGIDSEIHLAFGTPEEYNEAQQSIVFDIFNR